MAYGPGQAFPPVPAVAAGTGFTGVNPAWLAGTADRERTVGVLRAAFAEGRLTQDELDGRVERAYAARTYSDLWALIADVPAGPLPFPSAFPVLSHPQATPAVPPSAEPGTGWHSAAALVITALVIFTLAALVTAIATAHAQPMGFQPGPFQPGSFQQAPPQPFEHAQLTPFIMPHGRP